MDGAIPNVPDAKATGCSGALGLAVFPLTGIPILDGSRSACGWDTDPDAVVPGIFGPAAIPRLFRRDYVENGNDSHWLSNPEEPLTGLRPGDRRRGDHPLAAHAARPGDDRAAARRHRRAARQGLHACASWPGSRSATASTRASSGATSWSPSARRTRPSPATAGPVDVRGACPVLAAWDLRDDLDSAGAILFRRFVSQLLGNFDVAADRRLQRLRAGLGGDLRRPASTRPIPVNTPRGLNTDNPLVGRALADAVTDLAGAGIPLDGTLRDFQYDTRGGKRIPIHGGPGTLGVFNAINVQWDPERGYPDVPHGSSFIAAMTLGEARLPGARAHLRHLRRVREPDLAPRARLHEGVLAQALEPGPVLPGRHPRAGDRRRAVSAAR